MFIEDKKRTAGRQPIPVLFIKFRMNSITRAAWLRQYFFKDFPAFGIRTTNDVESGTGHASLDAVCSGKYTHVQAEPYNCYTSIVLDIDYDYRDAAYATSELDSLPAPNLAIMNPENGRAHLVFLLATPVHNNKPREDGSGSSTKAVAYYKRVSAGLGLAYGADMSYTQLICKNPCSSRWIVDIVRERPYTLDELADWIYVPQDAEIDKAIEKAKGEGRNCTLFELVAAYAHKTVHRVRDFREFQMEVSAFAYQRNSQVGDKFSRGRLPDKEVETIIKSVVNWTWNNYRLPKEEWADWCRQNALKGNAKSVQVRHAKKEGRKAGVLQLLATGKYTQQQVADLLEINVKTVKRYAAEGKISGGENENTGTEEVQGNRISER